jgi:hypothetical protein
MDSRPLGRRPPSEDLGETASVVTFPTCRTTTTARMAAFSRSANYAGRIVSRPVGFRRFTAKALSLVMTSCHVYRVANRLEVVRVHARMIAAKVVNLQYLWNWSAKLLIHNPMRTLPPTISVRFAIASLIAGSYPNPAWRRIAAIFHNVVRPYTPMVVVQKPDRLSFDVATRSVVISRKRCSLTATALTETVGDGILIGHRSAPYTLVPRPGMFAHRPALSFPRLYQRGTT